MSVAAKERQAAKIKEISLALASLGCSTVQQQADALGLCRSTAWTVVKSVHKASGLSVHLINQMLAAPDLPAPVRDKINEYVRERLSGAYGHSRTQLHRFASRLSGTVVPTTAETIETLQPPPTRLSRTSNSPSPGR